MARIKLNPRSLSVTDKIAKARQIVTAMTDNNNFPNPRAVPQAQTSGGGGALKLTRQPSISTTLIGGVNTKSISPLQL